MKKYLVTTVSALSLLGMTAFSAHAGIGNTNYGTSIIEWTTTDGISWTMTSTPGTGIANVVGDQLDQASVKSPVIKITNNGFPGKFALVPAAANMHTDKRFWKFGKNLIVTPNKLTEKHGGYIYDTVVKKGKTVNIDFDSNVRSPDKILPGKHTLQVDLRSYTD